MLAEGAITQSWDTAIKAGPEHDASACATFEWKDGMHRLINMKVLRAEYPVLKRCIVDHAMAYRPQSILIEDKASGQSLLQDIRRECALPLIGIQPKGDKVTRVARITAYIEAGYVALPKAAPWLAAFETEILGFPDHAHDDQVDAMAQYLNWIRDRFAAAPNIRSL